MHAFKNTVNLRTLLSTQKKQFNWGGKKSCKENGAALSSDFNEVVGKCKFFAFE